MNAAGNASDVHFRNEYDGSVEVNYVGFLSDAIDFFIIQFDTLFLDKDIECYVKDLLKRGSTPISISCIASHSHSLPAIDVTKPKLGVVNSSFLNNFYQKKTLFDSVIVHL